MCNVKVKVWVDLEDWQLKELDEEGFIYYEGPIDKAGSK